MVFYLDFYEELGIYFYCLEFNISIYNLRYVSVFLCVICVVVGILGFFLFICVFFVFCLN